MTKEPITIDAAKADLVAEAKKIITRTITHRLRSIHNRQREIKHMESVITKDHADLDELITKANSSEEELLTLASLYGEFSYQGIHPTNNSITSQTFRFNTADRL